MDDERIRIEGPPEALLALSDQISEEIGDAVEVEPVAKAVPGELREPLTVAMIISASSAATVKAVAEIIQRYMSHLERKELLQIYREKDRQEITLKDLLELDL
jgi:hypothetical protein